MSKPMTPWGISEHAHPVTPGVVFYTTDSHGGYHVAPDKLATMPVDLRAIQPFAGWRGWYEEDCDWAIVCIAWPEAFPVGALPVAVALCRQIPRLKPAADWFDQSSTWARRAKLNEVQS